MVEHGVFAPAHVLAEAVRRREASSVEVVDANLAQIARHNPEIRTAVESLVRELAGGGATVEQGTPDVDLVDQYELGKELFDLLAGTFPEEPTAFSDLADGASEEIDSLEAYLTALHRRDEMIVAWNAFFTGWDALIMPAGTNTAERHGEEPERPHEYPDALSAVSGCPMVVMPAGVDRRGLPFGLQIIGGRRIHRRFIAGCYVAPDGEPQGSPQDQKRRGG